MSKAVRSPPTNHLLAALPKAERKRLLPNLEPSNSLLIGASSTPRWIQEPSPNKYNAISMKE